MNAAANRQKGFSVTEVLLTMALSLMLAIAIGSILIETKKSENRVSAESTRSAIENNVRFSANNSMALFHSVQKNMNPLVTAIPRDCICGRSSCTENTAVSFILTDITGKVLSGTTAAPVKYDLSGNPCDGGASYCVFEVTTHFTCKGTLCGKNSFLEGDPVARITYELKLTAEARANKKEFSYFKDVQSLSVDSSMKSMQRYRATLCP